MALNDDTVVFQGGMNQDDAPEIVYSEGDYVSATNARSTGTIAGTGYYLTNIESTQALSGSLLPGINNVIGGGKFDDTGQILAFRFNSAGNCQLVLYTSATQTYQVIYTDVTDSAGQTLLPLDPQNEVTAILVNKTYAVWWANGLEVGYTNLNTLASGGYGTVLWEDLSLLKPQCLVPPTFTFGSDTGTPANYLYGNLAQFAVQYVNADYNYSAWSTWSKRATPYQENTPTLGASVSQNNYLIVTVNIGSVRTSIVNIACRFGLNIFYNIKSVTRAHILSLPTISTFTITGGSGYTNGAYANIALIGGAGTGAIGTVTVSGNAVTAVSITTQGGGYAVGDVLTGTIPGGTGWSMTVTAVVNAVNVSQEIYEAYNAVNNTYSFAFYNNTTNIPIAAQEPELNYDYIWQANAGALINGNIIGLGGWTTLYARPATPATIGAVGYNPNIAIPAGTYANPLVKTFDFPGSSGSGAGNHKRIMKLGIAGSPNTNDQVIIITADIRNANATHNYTYIVPSGLSGNLAGVVSAITAYLPSGSYVLNSDGSYTITFIDSPYYGLQNYAIDLYFAGATVSNSIASILDNSQYQLALSYRDYKGRFFPLCTGNQYMVTTPSYAQVNGNAMSISWTIPSAAPENAVDYQWLITAPPITNIVETIATLLVFKATWNAKTNSPTLSVDDSTANVGDTYQVTTPDSPADTASYTNLGHNDTYNTGDYLVYNGQSYDLLEKTFGDLVDNVILAFSLNSLNLYNSDYQQQGVTTDLAYSFSKGDRCTLQYVITPLGVISSFSITAGTGYTNGTYTNIALTGGTGTGARGTVTVSGGVVTAVTLTNSGIGYTNGDSLTGTVTGGTGWSITVTGLVPPGNTYFNNPCVDLAVLGYDDGHYIVKIENSAAFTFSNGHVYYNGLQLDGRNIFMRLYSPALQNQSSQTAVQSTTVWYEIGERFPISGGLHTVTQGTLYDGGVYYKTRQFPDGVKPYANPPVPVLATDLNYSDFYPSAFWSAGRTRTYYDELEKTTQAASVITSQNYILGSKNNGLNRFYPSTIYGESDGQTSSSQGLIQIMWQRGQILVIIQQLNVFYCPVNIAFTQLNEDQTQESISAALLNNGRYAAENIGIGSFKESFWTRYDRAGFASSQYCLPYEIDATAGIRDISGKMSKYFKSALYQAQVNGQKVHQFYNDFYEEVIMTIQSEVNKPSTYPFTPGNWNILNAYTVTPGMITANNGSHSTVVYDNTTGIAVYTPASNYVGGDTATEQFNPGSGTIIVNVCLTWTSGIGTVNPFTFINQTGVPLSTEIVSNSIGVSGNDYPVAISITGGDYSLDGGTTWTNSAGTVSAGASVVVRVMSSASPSTGASCTLTIDSQTGAFTATTGASGNFTALAQYGMTIAGITGGSGIPSGYNPCNLAPGNSKSAAYTTLSAGSYVVELTGSPSIPGKTTIGLTIGGVLQSGSQLVVAGDHFYTLPLASPASDPTTVLFSVFNVS